MCSPRRSPGVQLGYQTNDDHVVHRSGQRVQAEKVDREHRADHVHGPVDEGVPDGLKCTRKGPHRQQEQDTARERGEGGRKKHARQIIDY